MVRLIDRSINENDRSMKMSVFSAVLFLFDLIIIMIDLISFFVGYLASLNLQATMWEKPTTVK